MLDVPALDQEVSAFQHLLCHKGFNGVTGRFPPYLAVCAIALNGEPLGGGLGILLSYQLV